MRSLIAAVLVGLLLVTAAANGLGKTTKYKKSDLTPNKELELGTGDAIVILEDAKPSDIKEIVAQSSNPDVKVRTLDSDGKTVLLITGDKKGQAKIGWKVTLNDGSAGGFIDLVVNVK